MARRSKTHEWLTPPPIIAAMGGALSFDLDPCAPAVQPYPTARQTYTRADNGLLKRWWGRVWLNFPYDDPKPWLARMADHNRGICFAFARTDIEAWHRYVWPVVAGALFIKGRVNFYWPDGTKSNNDGNAPSVLLAYGQQDLERLAFCGLDGKFVPLRFPRAMLIFAPSLEAANVSAPWAAIVADWMKERAGVRLDDLYRAFASHPKARANPNFKAKLRQTLQLGNYRRVSRGVWEAA